MVTVDAKGRIVLPKEVRERLGIDAGAEVTVRAEDGRIVVTPEDDPDRIIDDLEAGIERATADRSPASGDRDPIARDHRQAIRDGRTDE